jgi:molybdopterin-guanine dinucleotide biosynthesis protein A
MNAKISSARIAGVILCGGQSRRMGIAKATLPFGPETMLARTVRLLSQTIDKVFVVGAVGQVLPPLPPNVRVCFDEREANGPLEGLRVGLSAIRDVADAAFVTGCDTPLLVPAFVTCEIDLLGDHDAAVPKIDGFYHPLAAVYRTTVIPEIDTLIAAGRMRPTYLFDRVSTCELTEAELRAVDPQLDTLRNLNQRADYLAALAAAGFEPDPEILRALSKDDL